ncbi:MAG: hypothetical protein HW399_845, partial [Dehalococcoidia bacterium]|nr:hypothetical protein [Dehalococcoidia bacterium]
IFGLKCLLHCQTRVPYPVETVCSYLALFFGCIHYFGKGSILRTNG